MAKFYTSGQVSQLLQISVSTLKQWNMNPLLKVSIRENETLLLAGEKAKEYFLSFFEKKFCKDMDIESWYALERGINNPHAKSNK